MCPRNFNSFFWFQVSLPPPFYCYIVYNPLWENMIRNLHISFKWWVTECQNIKKIICNLLCPFKGIQSKIIFLLMALYRCSGRWWKYKPKNIVYKLDIKSNTEAAGKQIFRFLPFQYIEAFSLANFIQIPNAFSFTAVVLNIPSCDIFI